jgi:hypothetical protein
VKALIKKKQKERPPVGPAMPLFKDALAAWLQVKALTPAEFARRWRKQSSYMSDIMTGKIKRPFGKNYMSALIILGINSEQFWEGPIRKVPPASFDLLDWLSNPESTKGGEPVTPAYRMMIRSFVEQTDRLMKKVK